MMFPCTAPTTLSHTLQRGATFLPDGSTQPPCGMRCSVELPLCAAPSTLEESTSGSRRTHIQPIRFCASYVTPPAGVTLNINDMLDIVHGQSAGVAVQRQHAVFTVFVGTPGSEWTANLNHLIHSTPLTGHSSIHPRHPG